MSITLPELPYDLDALEPHVSAETLRFHHGKHHKAYVDKTNELVRGTEFENVPLEEIILRSEGKLFNNAAQAWNHSFFWRCLTPGGSAPKGEFLRAIERDFKTTDEFRKDLEKAAAEVFGSGWAWLVMDEPTGKLSILTTHNAENPLLRAETRPLLTIDVWEHAYYIDYRNERPKFLHAIWNVLNWDFAAENFLSKGKLAA